jgi:heat shock protein HslJ
MNARLFAILALSATIVLSIAACSLPGLPTGDPLKGTSWRLVTLGGAGLIPGTAITATFEDGQVHGSACNSYGGSYQVSGDKLAVRDLFMTEMACVEPQGIMEQEREYLEMLGMAKTFRLSSGQLQIFSSGGAALTFVPAP